MVLKEDEDLLIINKPSGIASLDEREEGKPSIIALARGYDENLTLCHRLDRDTSGCLILAKHQAAYRHISLQFEHRKVEKKYHALVKGVHQFEEQMIDLPLTTTRSNRSQVNTLKGKSSQTVISSLLNFDHYTLLQARPITGRLHQIRAHLAAIQLPIVQDLDYGGPSLYLSTLKKNFSLSKGAEERPMIQRMALHAYSLMIQDLSGKSMQCEAPYPKDFAVLIKQLKKYDQALTV